MIKVISSKYNGEIIYKEFQYPAVTSDILYMKCQTVLIFIR